ncbi:MAG: hypothetical protein AABX47_03695 [Nanoarchaeota archaeon]
MRNHNMGWMMLACLIPLLITVMLLTFDVDKGYVMPAFIALMIGAHIFMISGKGGCCGGPGDNDSGKDQKSNGKTEHH